jgi:hypothetical protein
MLVLFQISFLLFRNPASKNSKIETKPAKEKNVVWKALQGGNYFPPEIKKINLPGRLL